MSAVHAPVELAPVRTDAEWDELGKLFELVYGPEDAALWRDFHGRPPFFRREWCRVACVDGRIASHACWVPREMRVGSALVRAGFLGYVATHPDRRRRRLAAAVVEAWTDELTRAGEHISLVTGIPGFYDKFGYAFCFPYDWHDAAVAFEPKRGRTTGVRPYGAGELPTLARRYERENCTRTGSLVRTDEYWRWLLDGLAATGRVAPEDVWIFAGGYALVSRSPGRLELWEAAAESDEVASTLLGALAARAWAEGLERVDLKLPLDHRVTRAAFAAGAELSGYSYGIYGRILDLQGLVDALQPELERRLEASPLRGWSGTLRLATDAGTADLELGGGGHSNEVALPQSLLVVLVTGYADVRWVANVLATRVQAGLAEAGVAERLLPLLRALFPKGRPYVWNADAGY